MTVSTSQRGAISMTTAIIGDGHADAMDGAADLLEGIRNGDSEAWEEILRYGRLVSTTVRSFRLQEADALDAIQTTWLRLTGNADRVQFPERLSAWLVTTARRECVHILHRVKRGPHPTDIAAETVPDLSAGPEQRAIDAQTAQTLQKLINELPPLRQNLIRMLFTDDPPPTTRSPPPPESRAAESDPLAPGPYNSYGTSSTNSRLTRPV